MAMTIVENNTRTVNVIGGVDTHAELHVAAAVEGFDTAAKLLIAAGDNPHRIRSEAAWAHLCGVAPITASSGKIQRHRLNRGGNRQANSAIYRILLTRMAHDQATRDYITRRTAKGKTLGEMARILKRYAREIYKALPTIIN